MNRFKSERERSAYACPRSALSRGRFSSAGRMPKFAPMGWKSVTKLSLIYRAIAPIMVVGGRVIVSLPLSRCAALMTGKEAAFIFFIGIIRVANLRRMDEGVAVHHAVAQKLRVMQGGDHREHPLLLAEFEIRLEADEVVHGARGILLA